MNTILGTFYNDLEKLNLNQFPCGTGTWREERDSGYLGKSNVNQETMLALEELAHSDVFNVKCEWSDDIASLRQLAVLKPHIITEAFIFQHFKSLRLINKNINEVDKGLLKFTQLKELSLTGNSLSSIKGAYLPASLTVLQLFANKFTDLDDLATDAPSRLQHLGVGYNNLTDITSYISPTIWPNLLSLDLSHNKLGNVRDTLDCLSDLKTLRNLSLMANPITLAPGYMGYALDILPQLQILDDVSISEDDRLSFSGMSQEPLDWNQAIFSVQFPCITNLRAPPVNELIEESQFHYPVQKKYSYLIRFSFLTNSLSRSCSDQYPSKAALSESNRPQTSDSSKVLSSERLTAENSFVSQTIAPSDVGTGVPPKRRDTVGSLCGTEDRKIYATEELEWKEGSQLEFEQSVTVKCSDLTNLEEFLKEDIKFTVVEKMVESFTTIAPPDPVSASPPPSSKGGKKGTKDAKENKKKKEDKDLLKDKDGNILKWVEGSPTYHEIAYITLNLSSLLTTTKNAGEERCTVTEKAPPTPLEEGGRSSVCSAKGGKAAKAAKNKVKKVATPVPCTPPEPLKMAYKIERIVWSSVAQCKSSL